MKKLITLTLSLLLTLSLAACGGNIRNGGGTTVKTTADSSPPATSQDADSNTPVPTASEGALATENDADSIAGFLSHYGLTEDDIKPEHFIEFGALDMDGDTKAGEIGSTGFIQITVDKDAIDEEQIKAWYEKIYGKMQQLSSDGKLYTNFINLEEESTLQAMYDGPLWEKFPGTMWAYPYKMQSRDVKLNVSTSYNYETGIYKMSISVFGG